jgi:hypothetical protein
MFESVGQVVVVITGTEFVDIDIAGVEFVGKIVVDEELDVTKVFYHILAHKGINYLLAFHKHKTMLHYS